MLGNDPCQVFHSERLRQPPYDRRSFQSVLEKAAVANSPSNPADKQPSRVPSNASAVTATTLALGSGYLNLSSLTASMPP